MPAGAPPATPAPTDSILTFHAGESTGVRIVAGRHYKVRRAIQTDGQSALETPDNVIATRRGETLHLRYADGSTVTFEDFYSVCKTDAVCSVNLVSDNEAGITLSADNALGGTVSGDGGTLVYAHGDHDVLMSMAQGQAGLTGAIGALGDVPVLTYLPQSTHLADMGTLIAGDHSVVPGLAGLILVSGGLSGVTTASPSVESTASTIVRGTIQAGPITATNDLEVGIYAADGTTVLKLHVAVDSTGHFSTDIGRYTGVVFAKLFNKGIAGDYLDEATGANKDLSAPLMAMGVVQAPGVTLSLNLNALTTVAVAKMGAAPSATVVDAVNTAIAHAFGLVNLQETTVIPTNSNTYVATDGLSEGEKYGAVLAGFSGMDKLNGGNMQTTLDQVNGQISVAGSTATLTDSIKYDITAGAKVVAATPTNQPVVTTQFGDSVADLIQYVPNTSTGSTTGSQDLGLGKIQDSASPSASAPAPTLFDYANANVTGVDTAVNLKLINDVIKTKTPADVSTVPAVQTLADAVAEVLKCAAGVANTLDRSMLESLGITGLTGGNIQAVLTAIANTADDGSAVDTQAELQALVHSTSGLGVISAYAEANSASAPATPSGIAPTTTDYQHAGVIGVDDTNLGAINEALTSAALQGSQTDTQAEVQAIVDAYKAILAEANGAAADATPGVNPTPTQYVAIGADIGAAATDAERLALLNNIVGSKVATDVDTLGEINNLARIANAINDQAGGIGGLTMADLAAIGITGVASLSPGNIQNVLNALTGSADNGSGVDTLAKIQALVDGALDLTPPATPSAAPSGYADNVGRVQSLSSSAATTDDTLPGIHIGSLPAGATGALLYVDGVPVPATYDPASGTLTPTTPLADGNHSLRYSLTDAAGNESGRSPALNFTVDTSAPDTPSAAPTGYVDNAGANQSNASTAPATDDNTPGLRVGSLPAGATGAVLYVDGLAVSATYDPATGTLIYYTRLASGELVLVAIYAKAKFDNMPTEVLKSWKDAYDA